MTDIIAMAQSTPGVIAGNAAMIIGYRILGVRGALLSLLATVIPALVIVSALTLSYNKIKDNAVVISLFKGMQAGAAAVILNLVYKMGKDLVKKKIFL
jgi:chromate transporter